MYKTKPCFRCGMPSDAPLNVLALNGSLKHEPVISNTGELASLVIEEIRALGPVHAQEVRLSDATLPVGLGFRESAVDDWPDLVTKIKAADIVLFCTPIWWGGRSSLMQRLIERLDALDEESSATGRSAIKGKVAGIVITGSEDGALSVMGGIMMVLSFMGFTMPPECAAYWVGRSRTADVAGSRQATREHGHHAHGEGTGAESRLLRQAAESTPSNPSSLGKRRAARCTRILMRQPDESDLDQRWPSARGQLARPDCHDVHFQDAGRGPRPRRSTQPGRQSSVGPDRPRGNHKSRVCLSGGTLRALARGASWCCASLGRLRRELHNGGSA